MSKLIYAVTVAPCDFHHGATCPIGEIVAFAIDRKDGGTWDGVGTTHRAAIAQAIEREQRANGPLHPVAHHA